MWFRSFPSSATARSRLILSACRFDRQCCFGTRKWCRCLFPAGGSMGSGDAVSVAVAAAVVSNRIGSSLQRRPHLIDSYPCRGPKTGMRM